jgi:outer membrane autotransporter protein
MGQISRAPARWRGRATTLLLATTMLTTCPAWAATTNWTDGTGNWFTSSNWSSGVPGGPDTANVVNGGTAQISGAASAGTLNIDGGSTVGLLNGGTLAAGSVNFVSGANNGTLAFNTNQSTLFSGVISGGGEVDIDTGTVTFAGNNTYTGRTIVNGALIVGSGATSGDIVGDLVVNGTLTFNRSDTITYVGQLTGGGSFIKDGSGTLILAGSDNPFYGTTTISAGTLQVNAFLASGHIVDNGVLAIAGGGVGQISGTGSVNILASAVMTSGSTYLGGTTLSAGTLDVSDDSDLGDVSGALTIINGSVVSDFSFGLARNIVLGSGGGEIDVQLSDSTLSGQLSGPGGLTVGGTGTLRLTSANTYSGGTTIVGNGQLQISNENQLGAANGPISFNGGTLVLNGANISATHTITLGGGGGTINPIFGATVSADIGGPGGLTVTGFGSGLVLNGTNTYAGGTTVNGGTLIVANDAALGTATGTVALNNGTLQFGGGTLARNIAVGAGGGTISAGDPNVVEVGHATTISGVISGPGHMTYTGFGGITLTGDNTYTGGTTVYEGAILVGDGATSGSIVGDVVVGVGTSNSGINFYRSDDITFAGNISGAGYFEQAGTGVITLTGNNSWTGNTELLQGTVAISSASNLGTGPVRIFLGDLRFDASFESDLNFALGNAPEYYGGIDTNGNTVTLGGVISTDIGANFGGLRKIGAGTLILTGNNPYTGETVIAEGTLQIGNGGAGSIGATSDVIDNGTLDFDASSLTTFSQGISGIGSLGIAGVANVILTAIETYTGTTTIAAGARLSLSGSGSIANSSGVVDNGTFDITAAGLGTPIKTLSGTGTVVLANNLLTLTAANSTFAGTFTGGPSSGIVVAAGSLGLAGDNTFSGEISIATNAQISVLGGGSIANSRFILDNGVLGFFGTTPQVLSALIQGTGELDLEDHQDITLPVQVTLGSINVSGQSLLTITNDGVDSNINLSNSTLRFVSNGFVLVAGQISGDSSSPVYVQGSGTTGFSGVNTYAGPTYIADGSTLLGVVTNTFDANSDYSMQGPDSSLDLSGHNQVVRSLTGQGTVLLGAGVLTLGGVAGSFDGVITGIGGIVVAPRQGDTAGQYAVTLTGENTYTGTTSIEPGATLQIGAGGTSGSVLGDIQFIDPGSTPGGRVAFNRSDTHIYGGTVSGPGTLLQSGPGTTILTGDNTYTSGTTIAAGRLQLGAGGTTGSIAGDVVDNAVLAINRSDTYTFAGKISGTGGFEQNGSGTVVLTGANTFSETATINAGALQIGDGTTTGSIAADIVDYSMLIFDHSDVSEYGGDISGAGSVTQLGTGTTVLTGDSTFSGGTTIAAGTLQLGNGGTSGAITGDVVDNGTLAVDRSDTISLDGVISGSGAFNQIGPGTTFLTNTNTYSGPTTITNGILDVNGSIANSAVTLAGGQLKGHGTVGGIAIGAGAIVAPGNSIGTLHIAGNVTFDTSAIYQVEVDAGGHSDLIDATGSAQLNGGVVQVLAAPGAYSLNTTYDILNAPGGITGTFSAVSVDQNFLAAQLVYSADEVDLVLRLVDINFALYTHSANEASAAAAVKAGGFESTLYSVFLGHYSDTAAFAPALDQLSGDIHASIRSVALEDSRDVRQSVIDRLRGAVSGDASGMLGDSADDTRGFGDGAAMWVRAFSNWGTNGSNGNASPLGRSLSGIMAGVDADLGGSFRAGLSGGYTHDNIATDGHLSHATAGNGHVGVYGGWTGGSLALRLGVDYGFGNATVRRDIDFLEFTDQTRNKESVRTTQVFGEAGYALGTGPVGVEPFADVAWVEASSGAFAESGGAAALAGDGHSTGATYTDLGLRFATTPIGTPDCAVSPRVALAWQHAFGGIRPAQTETFIDTQESFIALGVPLDRDAAVADVGLDVAIMPAAKLGLGYSGVLGGKIKDHTVHADFSWQF